jgi:putative flippase GtrA
LAERKAAVIRWMPASATADRLGLLVQSLRFGIVGIAATLTHVAVFVALIQTGDAAPLLANALAFGVAFVLSFLGHFWWTFRAPAELETRRWAPALVRFLVIALSGFLLNTAVVFMVVEVLTVSYMYAAVLMVTVVPACVFVASKFWVFSGQN